MRCSRPSCSRTCRRVRVGRWRATPSPVRWRVSTSTRSRPRPRTTGKSQLGTSQCSVECKSQPCVATAAARCRLRSASARATEEGRVGVGGEEERRGGQGLRQALERPGGQPDPHHQERRGCGAQDPAVPRTCRRARARTLESDPIACAVAGVNQYTIEARTENDCGKSELGTSQCSVEGKLSRASATSAARCRLRSASARATRSRARPRTATARVAHLTLTIKSGAGACSRPSCSRTCRRVRSDAGERPHRLCGGGRQPVHDRGPDRERLWQARSDLAVLGRVQEPAVRQRRPLPGAG